MEITKCLPKCNLINSPYSSNDYSHKSTQTRTSTRILVKASKLIAEGHIHSIKLRCLCGFCNKWEGKIYVFKQNIFGDIRKARKYVRDLSKSRRMIHYANRVSWEQIFCVEGKICYVLINEHNLMISENWLESKFLFVTMKCPLVVGFVI